MRTITVPASAHARIPASDKMPFFQTFAKNVGIRRAASDNILATNIDILLTDDLFLGSTEPLNERTIYRADRWDIPFDPATDATVSELRSASPLRVNRIDGIHYAERGRAYPHVRGASDLLRLFMSDPIGFVRRVLGTSENGG